MELLSRSTKRLVVEMSIGIILYNLLLGVLAWVFLPIISYPVIPALWGLLAGAVGAILMFIHMAVTTERALESQNQSYASKTTIVQGMIPGGSSCRGDWYHGHEGRRIPAAADSQNLIKGGRTAGSWRRRGFRDGSTIGVWREGRALPYSQQLYAFGSVQKGYCKKAGKLRF